jgi:hypothetical protein
MGRAGLAQNAVLASFDIACRRIQQYNVGWSSEFGRYVGQMYATLLKEEVDELSSLLGVGWTRRRAAADWENGIVDALVVSCTRMVQSKVSTEPN